MPKPAKAADEAKSSAPDRSGEGPLPELVERFGQFEARVDEAVRLIAELRKDKQQLEARLEESTLTRAEAVRRIDALVDKIDSLL